MNLTEFYQACERLFDAGWTIVEMKRLFDFRDRFQLTSEDLPDKYYDMRHLEFIRWLVQTGRLSDW